MSTDILEKIPSPPAKRPRTLERVSAIAPACSHSPSELHQADLNKLEEAPPYYHWMALLLRDKFNENTINTRFTLDGVQIEVPTAALDTIVRQFKLIGNKNWLHEYDFTSQINRYLDRFYFDDAHAKEGAVLSQYPLQGTKRGDSCIVLYGNDWEINRPVLATNDSKLKENEFSKSKDESRLYSVCAASNCDGNFPYLFSFPLCPSNVSFEMHVSVNKKMEYINICSASFANTDELKRFFVLTYAVVRWAIVNNDHRFSQVPRGFMPKKGLELCLRFPHCSVFLKDSKVYKFFSKDGTKHPNKDVMESMGIQNVELTELSKEYSLLSYEYIAGCHDPSYQFAVLAHKLDFLHKESLVHGDVRCGNIIFTNSKDQAHLIDFDYTAKKPSIYPLRYNSGVPERHPDAEGGALMDFDHDWYSLIYLLLHYFPGTRSVGDELLQQHLDRHLQSCLKKIFV